jgi:hypothetical protein
MCQLAENAKTASHAHRLPEVFHNEILAWEDWAAHLPPPLVLFLECAEERRPEGPPVAGVSRERVEEELARSGLESVRVPAPAGGPLARALRQVVLGDAVSVLLAEQKGVAATPVEALERLKRDVEAGADAGRRKIP